MKNKAIYLLILIVVIIIIVLLYLYLNRKEYILDGDNMTYEKKEIKAIINNKELSIELDNNEATNKLLEKLNNNNIEISLADYGNFEKVGDLGFSLPTNDINITTKPGDIVLYQGNKIVIFYDSNTWSYTKLGHITNIKKEELISILGKTNINIIFKKAV